MQEIYLRDFPIKAIAINRLTETRCALMTPATANAFPVVCLKTTSCAHLQESACDSHPCPEQVLSSDADRGARFVEHLEPLQGAMEAYCRRSLNDPSAVEDVLQNAVANAYRDFDLYVENTNFRAWIFRYVSLEILAFNRRRQPLSVEVLSEQFSRDDVWEDALEEASLSQLREDPQWLLERCDQELAAALKDLPEQERSVLLLRAIGEFKYEEIGKILSIPVGSVMGYLSRARAKLRSRLADYCRQSGIFRDQDQ